MILSPGFYAPASGDRAIGRIGLGLRPDLPTALLLFGGEGSMEMVKIARDLNESGMDIQLIALCGRNLAAAQRLRNLPSRLPMFIEGFTRNVRGYMALSDFFIGKAGPGSISEALAMRLPVIVERNAWTLAHERYNADWIEERSLCGHGVSPPWPFILVVRERAALP
jgi:UDP-N-acetylglucosamine:LPS N-acetylglucosamine transferase